MQTLQDLFGPRQRTAGLAFRTIGEGPTLVLLHGGSGSRTHWARNVTELSKHFEVITLDLPGFGESAAPPSGIEANEYIAWVADAIELQLAGRHFDMAAFSFGGSTTASVAARLAARGHQGPRRVTLVSPSGFGEPVARHITLEKINRHADVSDAEVRAATARNLGKWMLSRTPSADEQAVDIHLENVTRTRFDSRPISFRDNLVSDLRGLEVPLQVLLGKADPLVFPSLDARAALLRDALPHARVEIIEGGHWLQYDASEAVNRRIAEFHLPRSHP